MSTGKLDQSLDEILSTKRRTATQRKTGRRASGRPAAPAAPVGGIHKNTRAPRNAATNAAPAKFQKAGTSKIVVSNMPKDVSEKQIKEYFVEAVGPVKKVEINYGPNRVSRGEATVIFIHSDGANKAFKELNGLLVDGRPVKVEVVLSSADQIPAPKTLSQRLTAPKTQPKAQPKSAAADKSGPRPANGAKKPDAKKPNGRRGRNARPTKKTAEELDSDMQDYFADNAGNDNAPAANGAAPAAAAGDAAMEDEIL